MIQRAPEDPTPYTSPRPHTDLRRPRVRARIAIVAPALVVCLSGCYTPEKMEPAQLERGYVVMLPGVEGSAWQFADSVKGLREAGVDRAIEIVPWDGPPFGMMLNLTDLPRNQQRAEAIAARINAYARDHPGRPVTLIGYSGGGGLALIAAEKLADGVQLDRLILLGAAISPQYPLTEVVRRCRNGIANFYSPGDWCILGIGTKLFGTIDRVMTESAGHVGFQHPDGKPAEQDGLQQVVWTRAWSRLGHGGGHRGWLRRPWNREVLAPAIDPTLENR